ncbi:dihydroorotase, multifunctional complex type [Thermocrinis albus DSM 14484]|uniref:Dihydroorotase n=1 Tax=Thermocrinis albus (strain DSM 14484 / JCM 11386 / HI 11/12) TaxID=638303 RepID=D3SLX4_THEAH|nr:dihydroorotase [Thermocrinis albus]ADC89754.1 dihydroorotase, multifunctional complex type [Thermocrinis albus DSM 14484]
MSRILLKKGRVVDPSQGLDETLDVLIDKGKIKALGKDLFETECLVLHVEGCVVAPAFVDIHVHMRDPGQTYKEDIETACRSAVAGGFTTLVCMPNTEPPIDNPHVARYVIQKGEKIGLCNVLPAGAITKGRKGKELTDFYALKMAGCVALTDDGSPLTDSLLMKRALQLAKQLGLLVMNHCEDDKLAYGSINEGSISDLLGLSVRPVEAEDILVARDCILSYRTGCPVHIQHVSSALSVEIIRFFKKLGAPVSCEVNPYHLLFTEKEILSSGADAKVNPPLRREEDRAALLEAVADGTIDCIATDHAPHHTSEKELVSFALPGMIGLQTALPIALSLVREGHITMQRMVELMSCNPARLLGIEGGSLRPGSEANVVVFDPEREWTLDQHTNLSRSKNTPLWGKKLKGKVLYTIYRGKVVYSDV